MSTAGQAVGGVVGAVAGFMIGGPTGAMYGAQIGMAAGGYLDPPKGPTIEGPRLNDLSAQTSTYGARIPRVYGTTAVCGNIFWLEHNKLKEVVTKTKTGGKGGGGSTATTKTYSYYATFAVGLCEGPISGIRRIWIGPDLFYDGGATSMRGIIGSTMAGRGFTLYKGDSAQLAHSRMQADLGAANCPAYRGLAYIVFHDLPLEKYGNSLAAAQVKVEIVQDMAEVLPTYFSPLPAPLATNERIVYADEHGYQTAEALPGSVSGTVLGVDTYSAEIVFRDYTLDGSLIRTERQRPKVTLAGTSSLTFYKSLYLSGVRSTGFAYRASGTPVCTLAPSVAVTAMAGIDQVSENWRGYAGGYAWLYGSASQLLRLRLAPATLAGEATTYSIHADCYAQHVRVVEDSVTGRCFRRWAETNSGKCYVEEFNPDTLTVIWSHLLGAGAAGWSAVFQSFTVNNNRMTICGGNHVRVYDVSSASGPVQINQSPASANDVYPFAPGFSVVGKTAGGGVWRTNYKPTINAIPLAAIVEAECVRSGLLTAADLNTTDLQDSVIGYVIGSVGSVRAAIEPLRGAYPFDVIQSGFKIKFVSRGNAPVALVSSNELIGSPALQIKREMDSQLANEIELKYRDKDRNYDTNSARWERVGQAVNRREIDMPVVITPEQAQQIAERLGNLFWLERNAFGPFTLPPTLANLEPADVITLATNSAVYELRLTTVNYKSDGTIECLAAENNAAVYISTAVSDAAPDGAEVLVPSSTIGAVLDIPTIDQTVQTTPGVSIAAAGTEANWPGCVVMQSIDRGQTWETIGGSTAPVTMGFADMPLAANEGAVISSEQLFVRLRAGSLASVTVEQMLAGSNVAAYGNAGRWEIIRFATATLQGAGDYVLTDLVRGDFGTEWATGTHEQGDFFVMLDDPDILQQNIAHTMIGSPISYGFVTAGESLDDNGTEITWGGVSAKCLAPVNIRSEPGVSPAIGFTWSRRSRFASTWWTTGQPAPIAEEAELYEIDILGAGGAVVRTLYSGSPGVTYTVAQQTEDHGAPVSSVNVRVYQLSAVIGRGYGAAATVYAA